MIKIVLHSKKRPDHRGRPKSLTHWLFQALPTSTHLATSEQWLAKNFPSFVQLVAIRLTKSLGRKVRNGLPLTWWKKSTTYKLTLKRGTKLGKNKLISLILFDTCFFRVHKWVLWLGKNIGFRANTVRSSIALYFLDTTLRNCVRYKPCLLGNRFYGMMLENKEEKA